MTRIVAIIGALLGSTLMIATPPAIGQTDYRPSPLQLRVDRSFSKTEIETPFKKAERQLKEERSGGCEKESECDWLDQNKVRHSFWGDSPNDLWVVVKSIKASDFSGRPIPAVGIGMARSKAQILAAVRRFAPTLKVTCGKAGKVAAPSSCSATLDPGWLSFEFDAKDRLIEIRLDGYHFT